MKIPFSPPDITQLEIDEVIDTLKSGWITTGPKTKLFEKKLSEYCNTSKTVCLNSATSALEMTLRLLGIGKGDEVITTAYTYTASASVVHHINAKLVLIDTLPDSYEINYDKIYDTITEKTKAIIPVNIAGVMCDYDKLYEIVNAKSNIFKPSNNIQEAVGRVAIIFDGAHSLGAMRDGKKCGEVGDFTTFSFHAVKNLTTGEGGAVTWNTINGIDGNELYKIYMLLSLHGQSKDAFSKIQASAWEYDIVAPYYKCNMTDIMASIGLAQLRRYNDILARRKFIIKCYDDAMNSFASVDYLKHFEKPNQSSGHLYLTRLLGKSIEDRNKFIKKMAELGIATNVHYKPLPLLTAYKNLGFDIKDYPNAYNQYKNEVTIPLYSTLTNNQVDYIIDCYKKVLSEI